MPYWKKVITMWLIFPLLLTGCWDKKDIQDINYITSIGFDYVDNQYVAYVQLIDFSSVAKMESGKPNQPVPVWIGKGKGDTAISAVNDIYPTSQLRLFYGQINSIVMSENVLKKGLKDVDELQHRYYEMRYTPWVFGTRESLDKIFAATPFFNLSPFMSVLHQPQEGYKQKSTIQPLRSREFVSNIQEPGMAALLPSLSITNRAWLKDEHPHAMLEMDGVFVFQDGKYEGWAAEKAVPGLRWVNPKTNRSPLILRQNGEPQAALSLEKPKVDIVPNIQGKEVSYTVDVKLSGYISEIMQPMSEQLMEEKAAKQIQEEIKKTFVNGLDMKSDLLQLGHALYRQKNKDWKRLYSEKELILTPDSLKDIKVSVQLNHAGKLKATNG
ncbi:Ger(x)C family spore germination protein [Paenibacillus chartarius]|uniref:Ger(X)C family spore germination protein n=1 Tax=Paenibacillus chartarius TaxID=747481 RepID=A0ABV6DJS5_9BACL